CLSWSEIPYSGRTPGIQHKRCFMRCTVTCRLRGLVKPFLYGFMAWLLHPTMS
ncbi:hypothetical protein PanWU01x14_210980, partial [Parasponia andersonii]